MAPYPEPDPDPDTSPKAREVYEFERILSALGLAMVRWQSVEHEAWYLFSTIIKTPSEEITSVLFYHIQSFDSRISLLDRIMHYYLTDEFLRSEWSDLHKDLKAASGARNKLAHYSFEMTKGADGGFEFSIQPSRYDKVAPILGRIPEKAQHNLTAKSIETTGEGFSALSEKIERFAKMAKRRARGIGLLAQALERPLPSQGELDLPNPRAQGAPEQPDEGAQN